MQQEAAEFGMRRFDRDRVYVRSLSQGGFRLVRPPSPGIAEPQGWQQVQAGGLGSPIAKADLDQDVGGSGFCVLDEDVKIPVLVKNTRIE